jgi:hypothetical protein
MSDDGIEESAEAPTALRVRPYTVTKGRTDTDIDLSVETMIHVTDEAPSIDPGVAEAVAIVELLTEPLSIAEISAHLSLPLQVVKVLVGDLVIAGAVDTNRGGLRSDGRPDLALLERVLDGLQSL